MVLAEMNRCKIALTGGGLGRRGGVRGRHAELLAAPAAQREQAQRHAGDPSPCAWGVEQRAEFSALGPRAAVSWPWVPAWGSLEPPRRDAQKTGDNG